MALLLYRIGKFSFRHHWRVIITWLVVLLALLGIGVAAGGTMKESFVIPGTESQDALDRLEQVFPQVAGSSAQVVLEAPAGHRIDEYRAEIEGVVTKLADVPHVEQALDPYSEYATGTLSDDGEAAIIQVQFDSNDSGVILDDAGKVREIATTLADDGLKVDFGGQIYQDISYGLTITEVIGVAFAAIVLIVAFGSVLAAGMPLISAVVAVGTTMGAVLISASLMTVSNATPLLAVMIGLAVGIDYALFIMSRHRHQLANGMDAEESAAVAVGTSGSAVVFAGATVMVALMGLLIVGIPFLSVMGVAAAVGVFMALLASLTLVPAMLGLAGERMRPKEGSRAWRRETGTTGRPSMGRRWVRLVLRMPWVAVILVIGVLGAIAVPALHMQTSLPSGKGEAVGMTARDAYDTTTAHFGEGRNAPMLVMLDITQVDNDTLLADLDAIRDLVRSVPGVAETGNATPNPTVDSAIIQVIPTTGPDDPATADTVAGIRALAPEIHDKYGAVSSVSGITAVQIDITQRLNGALLPFALVVVGLSFVLLMMVFRSVLVPLKAAVGFLLSAFAAFGVVVLVFQDGIFGSIMGIVPGPIIAFLPVLLLAIVFGLAMDYEVFLVSGMRESYVHGRSAREAVEEGFAGAARVVTAAALIMFFVFAAFVPEGAGVIKVIALGLAVGVFFDAFLVRMTLVPAIMALFGDRAWRLPAWLDRILPNLDIEGEHLREHLADAAWAAERDSAITADGLRVGDAMYTTPPLDAEVPRGGILLVEGTPTERRLLAATLAGRLAPREGRAQVLGRTLPGDAGPLASRVAYVDVSALSDRDRSLTLAQLVGRHGAYGGLTLRSEVPQSEIASRLNAMNTALRGLDHPHPALRPSTRLDLVDATSRAIALAGIALAERPELLLVDLGALVHTARDAARERDLIRAIAAMAPAETTLVVGSDVPVAALADEDAAPYAGRASDRPAAGRPGADRPGADGHSADRHSADRHSPGLARPIAGREVRIAAFPHSSDSPHPRTDALATVGAPNRAPSAEATSARPHGAHAAPPPHPAASTSIFDTSPLEQAEPRSTSPKEPNA